MFHEFNYRVGCSNWLGWPSSSEEEKEELTEVAGNLCYFYFYCSLLEDVTFCQQRFYNISHFNYVIIIWQF